jgi:hypothetical protein
VTPKKRTPKWTPDSQQRFLRLLGEGVRFNLAATEAGLPVDAIADRLEKDGAFMDAVIRAAADGIVAVIKTAARPRRNH